MSDTLAEDTLLRALGCLDVAPAPQARTVRLLLQPAFDPASCLLVEERASAIEMRVAILRRGPFLQQLYDLVLAARRDPGRVAALSVPQEARWEDIAALTAPQAEQVRALYARAPPSSLTDVLLGARDGLLLRLECWGPEGAHAVRMWSPTAGESPAHHDWLMTLIAVAQACFTASYARDYLERLQRYLAI